MKNKVVLQELVSVNEKFQKSINVRLDYNQMDKIENYIPTRASLQILDAYLDKLKENKGDNATLLIGPYGKGKSHLLLVLTALLSKKNRNVNERTVLERLIERINGVDEKVGTKAKKLLEENKVFLPVFITSTTGDLGKSFLLALKEALEREGLEQVSPNTYFEEALAVITQWKQVYPKVYDEFLLLLQSHNLEENAFLKRLCNYEDKMLALFQKIYPTLTAGSVFEPMVQMDIVPLYESVNREICEKYGYSGIVIIFDEFSKFMEGYPKEQFSYAMKQLQDICELSEKKHEQSLHIILVAHKAIKEYRNMLEASVINAYTGVEGRIGELRFTVSMQNSYELIQNAIEKKNLEKLEVQVVRQDWYQQLQEESYQLPFFRNTFKWEEFCTIVMKGCFPLVPVATYLLLKISECAVQNERTVFTFLANDERGSLARFIKQQPKNVCLVTAGLIYDYFSNVFKKDVSNVRFHKEWLKAEYALTKVDTDEKREILKTLALIRMVGNADEMEAKEEVLRLGTGLGREIFQEQMEQLRQAQIVFYRSKTKTYSFKNNVGVDIEKEIEKIKQLHFHKINISYELEKVAELEYEFPKKYNQTYTMTRYFRYHFMTVENFKNLSDSNLIFEDKFADGKLIALIKDTEVASEEILAKLKEWNDRRIVVIEPMQAFSQENNLKKLLAVRYLKKDEKFLMEHKALKQELDIYEEDLCFEINAVLEEDYLPTQRKCRIFHEMHSYDTSKIQKEPIRINTLLSEICEEYYELAPKINNEMINKREPTSQIKKARIRLIEQILNKDDFEVYTKGTSAEATIFRAVFFNTGIISFPEQEKILEDAGARLVLEQIENFMQSASREKKSFQELYQILQGKQYGIRKGVLPLYLAYVLSMWEDMPVLYYGNKEVRWEAKIFDNINESPQLYYLYVEKDTIQKRKYLLGLEDLFCSNQKVNETRDRNQLAYISDGIYQWYCSLPACSKSFSYGEELKQGLQVFHKEFRKIDRNPRELLLERLPHAFGTNENFEVLLTYMEKIKRTLEEQLQCLQKQAVLSIRRILGFSEENDLLYSLKEWKHNVDNRVGTYVHSKNGTRFMQAIEQLSTHDTLAIADKLSKEILDLYIADWKENTLEQFDATLEDIVNGLVLLETKTDIHGEHRILFTNSQGIEVERRFRPEEEDYTSQFLQNEIESTLEEYGDSLETNQKVSVMLKLLEKIIEG